MENTNLTFDIHFNDSEHSGNKGFALSYEECEKYIRHNSFPDWIGGTVSIVCNETEELYYEEDINC